jgi:2-phospho-L-lactate guanylyltransferase
VAKPLNIIIPVKGFRDGKSRLAETLTVDERISLNGYLAARTLKVATSAFPNARMTVVSPDPSLKKLARSHDVSLIEQKRAGLNAGLAEAAAALPRVRTVIIASDLPDLTEKDMEHLVSVTGIGIAPDESGHGTNALSLPNPHSISFKFGRRSCGAHSAEAQKTRFSIEFVRRSGLAFDLDAKDDLSRLKGWP